MVDGSENVHNQRKPISQDLSKDFKIELRRLIFLYFMEDTSGYIFWNKSKNNKV
jgi:hypothetical protein